MKKIGIITFHRADNYGAVLQNYALLMAINQHIPNAVVNTIDYRSHIIEAPYHKSLIERKYPSIKKNLIHSLRRILVVIPQSISRKNFEMFRKNYLQMTESVNKEEINKIEESFDVIICGSDQVWNDKITGSDDVFSLGFTKRIKRISYAASAGNTNNICDKTLDNIKQFDAISVRENSLKKFLEGVLFRQVHLVVDPVFLIDSNGWNGILSKNRLVKGKYILVYSVGDKDIEAINLARKIASITRLKIVHIDLEMKYGVHSICKYGVSPLEFVQLINEAEIVVASSFHAVAFSIIFKRPFYVIPSGSTGDRIVDLLKICDLEQNIVLDVDKIDVSKSATSYKENGRLEALIKESISFLSEELSR